MSIKYFFKEKTLRQYCADNGINYSTVVKRIQKKMMSVEQAVSIDKLCQSYLICSDGVPLIKKCKTKSEYRACLWRIKNYSRTVDESLKGIDKGRARSVHFYNGKSFREICKGDELRYRRAIQRFRSGHTKKMSLFGNKWDLIYG